MADERVQRRLAAIRCYIQTHFRLLQKDFLAVADKSSLDLKPPRFCILLVATFEIVRTEILYGVCFIALFVRRSPMQLTNPNRVRLPAGWRVASNIWSVGTRRSSRLAHLLAFISSHRIPVRPVK